MVSTTGSEGDVATNFRHVTIQLAGEMLSILCNRSYPVLAIVPQDQTALGTAFVSRAFLNPSQLGPAFTAWTDLRPLDPVLLQSPLTPDLVKQLGPHELDRLRYWQKCGAVTCVGALVFNYWD